LQCKFCCTNWQVPLWKRISTIIPQSLAKFCKKKKFVFVTARYNAASSLQGKAQLRHCKIQRCFVTARYNAASSLQDTTLLRHCKVQRCFVTARYNAASSLQVTTLLRHCKVQRCFVTDGTTKLRHCKIQRCFVTARYNAASSLRIKSTEGPYSFLYTLRHSNRTSSKVTSSTS
jgi:hypothetical protein